MGHDIKRGNFPDIVTEKRNAELEIPTRVHEKRY